MNDDLQAEIESFLLARGTWVSASEIVEHFGLGDDRVLRARKRNPGLLDNFAFAHAAHGVIHHLHLPQKDFLRLDNSLGRHAISELRKRKRRRAARRNCIRAGAEIHSGQMTFFQ